MRFLPVAVTSSRKTSRTSALDVLRHRVIITYEAEAEDRTSESIVTEILESHPVP